MCGHMRISMQSYAGSDATDFAFPEFLDMLAKCPSPASAKEDILNAFRLNDRAGKGTISAGALPSSCVLVTHHQTPAPFR